MHVLCGQVSVAIGTFSLFFLIYVFKLKTNGDPGKREHLVSQHHTPWLELLMLLTMLARRTWGSARTVAGASPAQASQGKDAPYTVPLPFAPASFNLALIDQVQILQSLLKQTPNSLGKD